MKIMKRIKDILFDEEEVEIPVIEETTTKKQPERKIIKEESTDSITELKMPEDDFSDKENLKSELTFPFPIEFEEDELEKTKPIETFRQTREPIQSRVRENTTNDYKTYNRYEVKKETPSKEREIKDYSSYLKTKEEKKQFKPTPIISPVYGVLDQNYTKEDLVVKEEIKRKPTNKAKLDLDEIRKKAYGVEPVEDKEIEVIEDEDVKIDPNKTIGELMEEESIILPELDNTIKEEETPQVELNDLIKEKEEVEKKIESQIPEVLESDDDETDLFSLIDSMYEENNE